MLIDDIDFAELYRQQLKVSGRTKKSPAHWDARAEKMAANCAQPTDSYLQQLLEYIDLTGAESLLDMGCGPGTVALALADKLKVVYGVDYSQGMLDIACKRATHMGIDNTSWISRAWEDSWQDIPRCDIAIASRSTLVSDMYEAMDKLNRQARLRVYTTHLVSPTFMSPVIQRVLGREVIELPNYIYAVNVLYQMGIHARVNFIHSRNCQNDNSTFERFAENVKWTLGVLSDEECARLRHWYQEQDPHSISPATRDWALISWDCEAQS